MIDKDMLEAIGQMMDAKLEPINTRLTGLEEEQRHTRVLVENMGKQINALAEGQAYINEKFKQIDQIAEDATEIKIKVSALESVTKDNTSQIKQLRAIK